MSGTVREGDLLWQPSHDWRRRSHLQRYVDWLGERRGLDFTTYEELWRWSVRELESFWGSVVEYFDVQLHAAPEGILPERRMPSTRWLPGATLNHAEQALRWTGDEPAIIARDETGGERRLSRDELRDAVSRAAAGLRRLGVSRGDRVVAFAPNVAETLVAFLATASLGATWSSVSPEFGVSSVLDRFRQVEPTILFAVTGSTYGGKRHDRRAAVERIREGLPSLREVVVVPSGAPTGERLPASTDWEDFLGPAEPLRFEAVPFDHPLWVLYSSGTTGLPKAIVQGHGGILLEHLKACSLHVDLGPGDRFFWFTTTGWMMWNFLVGGLLVGSCVVLYDGSPAHPDLGALWRLAEETQMTYFGTSAPYLLACRKEGLVPKDVADLGRLRGVGSTGAPLPPEGFAWVYENVGSDLLLGSVSGGTDVCTAFVLSCPWLPVRAGEIQCRGLGCAVEAFDESGSPIVGEVGELVLTEPLPSMPTRLWDDDDGSRLRESYFAEYPGTWRHGDWIRVNPDGSCVISGRSDSTLNRAGVRMGTSEFYRVVESVPQVADSLVVDTGSLEHEGKLWLFLVPRDGAELDEAALAGIRRKIREELSPRHVPDEILAIDEVPRTLNGKKLEVPVKRILTGTPPERAASKDSLANPESLDVFVRLRDRA